MIDRESKLDISPRLMVLVVAFLVGLLGFWVFRMVEIYKTVTGTNPPPSISVEAEGKGYIIPDVAEVTLGVTTDAKTSESAIKDNTKKMNAVMAEITKLGVDKKDIQTTSFYLNPKYNWTQDQGSIQDGYTLTQQVLVKVRDFAKIGDLLATTTKAGANMVGGINFTVDDLEKAKTDARTQAIAKAKEKAKEIAKQSGLDLGEVINYYEYQSNYYDYGKGGGGYAMAEGGGSPSAAPIIEPGQQEVDLTVTLTFKLN
jgi:uncharacterized protein YggE